MPSEDRLLPGQLPQKSFPVKDYLSIKELCERIPYEEQTIRNLMSQGKLVQGMHYFKPNGRLIFKWSAIVQWIEGGASG